LVDTKVTLGRLEDGGIVIVGENEVPVRATNLDHPNVVIGTTVGAGRTPDAGGVVDDHLSRQGIPMNRAGGAPNHAHGVGTVHASVGDHIVSKLWAVPNEAGIIVVGGGAGADTVVATGATV